MHKGLIGAILGSFIATLVLRWPAGRSLLGRSRCDGCDRPLGALDLVPLLSALLLRGRCRRCGAPIDPFHSRVELTSALVGAVALALMPGAAGWPSKGRPMRNSGRATPGVCHPAQGRAGSVKRSTSPRRSSTGL